MSTPMPEPVSWAQLGLRNGHTYVRMHYEGHLYPPPADVQRNMNLAPLYTADQLRQYGDARAAEAAAALPELAMMLKMCAWALRRGTAPDLGERALTLLQKHNLIGSPLRAEPESTAQPAQPEGRG